MNIETVGERKRSKTFLISQNVKRRNNSQNISNAEYKIKLIPHNETTKALRNYEYDNDENSLNLNKINDDINM